MNQGILNKIKKEYKDITGMVKTNYAEADKKKVSPSRKKKVNEVRDTHPEYVVSEDVDVTSRILADVIETQLDEKNVGITNGILVYISELEYRIYKKMFKDELSQKERNPRIKYVLYMDIENNQKYFVRKRDSKKFEETHTVVRFKDNPGVNVGWNHDINMRKVSKVRREFIGTAMYEGQEEGVKQIVKKYGEVNKEGEK